MINFNKTIAILVLAITFSNCKKNYSCECVNPGGKQVVFTTKDTKKKAAKKCTDYYNQNYGSLPVISETSCEIK